jgi:curved DNA-binding protein CbpA/uncharacterized membrane protein
MSNAQIDYYAILKVSSQASPEQVKKSYRELARRYHPDVNRSPDAAQQIKAINEAYHVLGDPDRRATYDAERLLRAESGRQTAPNPAASAPSQPPGSGADRQSTPKSAASGARYGYNGFGRVHTDTRRPQAEQPRTDSEPNREPFAPRRPAATKSPPRPAAKSAQANIGQTVQSLVADAQMAYVMRRYNDAERLCRQVLTLDRRQPVVHEMLGDIYSRRGDHERATTAYAYAIQFNPRNQSAQIKLERLAGADLAQRGPTFTRPVKAPLIERILNGPNRDRFISATSLVLIGAIAGGVSFLAYNPGYDSSIAIGALSLNLLMILLLTGLSVGILLAFYGGMRPVSQELALRTNRHSPVDLSMLLSFSALIWFYLSLLIYIFVAVTRNRPSFSVIRIYGVSIMLSAAFAFLYHTARVPLSGVETAAFSGNLLFPTMLLGWRLGDRLRLSGT